MPVRCEFGLQATRTALGANSDARLPNLRILPRDGVYPGHCSLLHCDIAPLIHPGVLNARPVIQKHAAMPISAVSFWTPTYRCFFVFQAYLSPVSGTEGAARSRARLSTRLSSVPEKHSVVSFVQVGSINLIIYY